MVQLGKQEQGISPLMAVRDPGAVPTPGGTPCPFPAALSHCLSLEQQNSPAPHSVPSPRSSSPVPGTSFPILALPPGSRSQKRPNPTCTGWEGQEGWEKAGIGVLAAAAAPWTSGAADGGFRFSRVRNGSLQVPHGKGWASSSMILLGASSQPSVGARGTRNCLFPQERFLKKRNSPWDGSSSYNALKLFFYAAGSWCRHTVSEGLVGITEQTRNFPQIYSMARFLPHLQLLKARPRV